MKRKAETRDGTLWLMCTCCGKMLPETGFHRNSKAKYGRAYHCRRCANPLHGYTMTSSRRLQRAGLNYGTGYYCKHSREERPEAR